MTSPGDADAPAPLPFDGPVLVTTSALASVPPARLPRLLRTAQRDLRSRVDELRQEYERVVDADDREVFLVDVDHWERVGDRLGLDDRERAAIRRAHETQLERIGSRTDRRAEFEAALEIRTAVVIGHGDGSRPDREP